MRHSAIGVVASLLLTAAAQAAATPVTQFGPGGIGSAQLTTTLGTLGVPANSSSETTAESFVVPGVAGMVNLTFNFVADTGGFQFTFGLFDLSNVLADPSNQQAFATEAITEGTVVFDDLIHGPGDSVSLAVAAGTNLGFYLIPDNTRANFLANPGAFDYTNAAPGLLPGCNPPPYAPCFALRAPLFSVSGANPLALDQMLSFVGGGKTVFAFEDLTRAPQPAFPNGFPSDNSFHDLVFAIDAELEPVPAVPEPGSMLLVGTGLFGLMRAARRRFPPK